MARQWLRTDPSTGTEALVNYTPEEEAAATAREAAAITADAADAADVQATTTARAQIVPDLQAVLAAATWPAARGPLLRLIVFILRRMKEQTA